MEAKVSQDGINLMGVSGEMSIREGVTGGLIARRGWERLGC